MFHCDSAVWASELPLWEGRASASRDGEDAGERTLDSIVLFLCTFTLGKQAANYSTACLNRYRSRITVRRVSGSIRAKAKRPKTSGRVGKTNHRDRSSMVFTIERREAGESACSGVIRVVEPETHVKSVGGCQGNGWIKPEDLID
jgi:hypothetical protein